MSDSAPLVTIGIPTYNRELLLARAIDSALAQDYPNIEIVVSDNCSSDGTESLCQAFADNDRRIRYARQPHNLGPTGNFDAVLELASGSYFMWLGDDDYIDCNYISVTLNRMQSDPEAALVSGTAKYYEAGRLIDTGRRFAVSTPAWWSRVAEYYWKVSDNGAFYGLMRTGTIRRIKLTNAIGGDWLMVARLAASGRVFMLDETAVHRELGGASRRPLHTADTLGLPRFHAVFPYVSIAVGAFSDLATGGSTYSEFGAMQRRAAGVLVFFVLLLRAFTSSVAERLVLIRNRFRSRSTAV